MFRRLHAATLVLVVATGAMAACTHASTGGTSSPCDPLAPPPTTAEYTLTFEAPDSDSAGAEALLLDVQGGTASQMALGPGGSKAFLGDADAGVTPLTLVDVSAVAGMTIVNLPGIVEYLGDLSAIHGPAGGRSATMKPTL